MPRFVFLIQARGKDKEKYRVDLWKIDKGERSKERQQEIKTHHWLFWNILWGRKPQSCDIQANRFESGTLKL